MTKSEPDRGLIGMPSYENHPIYSKHEEVFRDWLDGESIWQICARFNIRVKEAEELVRHGTLMAMKNIRKNSGSRKKSPR